MRVTPRDIDELSHGAALEGWAVLGLPLSEVAAARRAHRAIVRERHTVPEGTTQ